MRLPFAGFQRPYARNSYAHPRRPSEVGPLVLTLPLPGGILVRSLPRVSETENKNCSKGDMVVPNSIFRCRNLLAALAVLMAVMPAVAEDVSPLVPVALRSRVKQADGSYRVKLEIASWDARQTAIVICDMWDGHYCRASESRVAEMAPVMNDVVAAARKRGVLIIHSPSGCMDKYEGTAQRKLAQQAPKVETKTALDKWCYIDKGHEGDLPIDDSIPCEDAAPRPAVKMFSKQHDAIKIEVGDAVTDSVEAYYLLKQRGIKNLVVMGVHTNMCVL